MGLVHPSQATPIKSIQRGTLAFSATSPVDVTISSVTTSKASVVLSGLNSLNADVSVANQQVRAELLNATTVRFSMLGWPGYVINVSWQVVEFT